MIDFFAKKSQAAVEVEHEMYLVFERRHSLSRRLMDAAKRRDEDMARDCTVQWLQTEVKLAQLTERYQSVMDERRAVLAQLGTMGSGLG